MQGFYENAGELVEAQQTIWLEPHASVQEAAQRMAEHRVGAIPVVASGELVGIFTERDLLSRVVAKSLNPPRLRVEVAMTKDLITVDGDVSLVRCLDTMVQHNFRHLPVLNNGKLIGVLSCRDIPVHYWNMQERWGSVKRELKKASN